MPLNLACFLYFVNNAWHTYGFSSPWLKLKVLPGNLRILGGVTGYLGMSVGWHRDPTKFNSSLRICQTMELPDSGELHHGLRALKTEKIVLALPLPSWLVKCSQRLEGLTVGNLFADH